eukprot:8108687-Alexandrium_andersonii.AAC.1
MDPQQLSAGSRPARRAVAAALRLPRSRATAGARRRARAHRTLIQAPWGSLGAQRAARRRLSS